MIDEMEAIKSLADEFKDTNRNILKMFLEDELPKSDLGLCSSLPELFVQIGEYYRTFEDETWDAVKGCDVANGNDTRWLRDRVNQ